MQQIRIDRSDLPKVVRTPEGYLRGDAVVTRSGVFPYLNPDGTTRMELRHPDDIMSETSLSTLSALPITIDHPTEMVNSANASDLSVGLTGDEARVDGQLIHTKITVTHKRGIDAVETGHRELSLGYTLDLIEEIGEYDGQPYTHRQTNVRYNHLALVPKARAGSVARLNLDGHAVEQSLRKDRKMTKVNLDGLEYEAAPEVAKALDKQKTRIDELEQKNEDAKKSYDEMKKEADSLQGKLDERKSEMDKLKENRGDAAIAAAAKERVSLLAKAAKVVNTDSLMDSTDREIKEAVIKERNDALDLAEKSDDYVTARFDAIIDSIPSGEAVDKQIKQASRKDSATERKDGLSIIKEQWKVK